MVCSFTAEQAIEYEDKKKETTSFESRLLSWLVAKLEGIEWLKRIVDGRAEDVSAISFRIGCRTLVKPKKGDTAAGVDADSGGELLEG
jgi:hypothetical protein